MSNFSDFEAIKKVILISKADSEAVKTGLLYLDSNLRVFVDDVVPVDRRSDVWAVVTHIQGDLTDPAIQTRIAGWRSRWSKT